MNNKLLLFLGLFLVVLAGCTTKDMSSDTTIDTTTGEVVITTGSLVDTGSLMTGDETSGLSIPAIDQTKVGQARIQGDQWFYINDISWKGTYYSDRNWILIGIMGLQSVDVLYGYYSGLLFIEPSGTNMVISFPVDEKTYSSYYPKLENEYITGYIKTDVLQVQDKRKNYQICKDGYDMKQEEVMYDREKYEGLLEKNPIRCFGEDKNYIYGWREYKQSEQGGYELMRIRK